MSRGVVRCVIANTVDAKIENSRAALKWERVSGKTFSWSSIYRDKNVTFDSGGHGFQQCRTPSYSRFQCGFKPHPFKAQSWCKSSRHCFFPIAM